MRKFSLYYYTLKNLYFYQIFGKLFSYLKKKYYSIFFKEKKLKAKPDQYTIRASTGFPFHDPWNNRESILNHEFCFLNKKEIYQNDILWNDSAKPLLWLFNINYFNYLYLLSSDEQESLILDWVKSNPAVTYPSWHPYVISLRVVNWIKSDIKNPFIQQNIFNQLRYLKKNLEYYIPANHYLENAKALIFGGVYFGIDGEGSSFFKKGISILDKEIKKQVLDDGYYFEKSPMYHALVLEVFLDIINIFPKDKHSDLLEELKSITFKMLSFYNSILLPNGKIPLLNDSSSEISLPPKDLINYSQQLSFPACERKSSFQDSGIFLYQHKKLFFLTDYGPIGPKHIPAHAHSNIFSFIFSIENQEILVDSGTFEYQAGRMRDYFRSSKAHNVLSLDSTNHAEFWSSFRVARQFEPKIIKINRESDNFLISGKFDGFATMIGDDITHQRDIEIHKDQKIIIKDTVKGKGEHLLESFFHLHPDLEIELKDNHTCQIKFKEQEILFSCYNANLQIQDSFYSPEFGKKIKNKCITVYKEASLPTEITVEFDLS